MNKPFEVRHVREFGDGCCLLEAINIKPGLTTVDLLEYVLTRKSEVGKVHAKDPHPAEVAEYECGHFTNTFIIPEAPIKRLTIYGGYHVWDYIYEV